MLHKLQNVNFRLNRGFTTKLSSKYQVPVYYGIWDYSPTIFRYSYHQNLVSDVKIEECILTRHYWPTVQLILDVQSVGFGKSWLFPLNNYNSQHLSNAECVIKSILYTFRPLSESLHFTQ